MSREVKQYSFNGLAGCVTQFKSRATDTLVGIYNSEQAGIESDPECKWASVCEAHGTLVMYSSLRGAMITRNPKEWCEACRGEDEDDEEILHSCPRCGRGYTRAEWDKLHFVGIQDDGAGGGLELRNCQCPNHTVAATMAVDVQKLRPTSTPE